jgi:multidrug resistance efflux pump
MIRQRGIRWLMLVAPVLLVATGTGAWHRLQATDSASRPNRPGDDEPEGVICFGYVDLEAGLTALSPARTGKVTAVLVRENQKVKAGDVLLRLDDEPIRLRVRQAEAELAEARSRLEEAQRVPRHHRTRLAQQRAAIEAARCRCEAARHQHERLKRLFNSELATKEEVLSAADSVLALESAERAEKEHLADLELIDCTQPESQARALVKAKQAQLEQAEHALSQCTLKAPEAGTLLRVLVRPGEVLTEAAGQPAFMFCPDRPRIIRAEVSQEKASQVATGQSVLLEDDANPDLHWRGKVQRVSDWYTRRRSILQDPLETQDVRTLECIIEPESAPLLRIGQKLRVTILPQE